MLLALVTTKSILAILLILLFCAIIWFFSPARRERLEYREIERRRDDSNYLQELCTQRAPVSCTNVKDPEYYTLEYGGSTLFVRNHRGVPHRSPRRELVWEITINTMRDTAFCWQGWRNSPDKTEISLGDLASELDLIFNGKPVYRYVRREEFALN